MRRVIHGKSKVPIFEAVYDTRKSSSTNKVLSLSISATPAVNVDWGDGTTGGAYSHTYAIEGVYTVKIKGGFRFTSNNVHLLEVLNWGQITLQNSSFQGASNMTLSNVRGIPLISNTLMSLFNGCSNLTTINNLDLWDTQNVTTMSNMFVGCVNFSQPVNFNTQSVTNMEAMFANCTNFNQPVNFNTQNVTTMQQMFQSCTNFNQPVNFNTQKVTTMQSMFINCPAFKPSTLHFDAPLAISVAGIFGGTTKLGSMLEFYLNVPKVSSVSNLFNTSSLFNPTNFYLNCAQVTNLNSFFANCSSFNPSVFDIVTTSVTSMEAMFQNCISFNHPVNFNTQNVTNMQQVFQNCTNFNQPVNLNTQNVTNMNLMFSGCRDFNQPINFNFQNVINMSQMFSNCPAFKPSTLHFDAPLASNVSNIFGGTTKLGSMLEFYLNVPKVSSVSNLFNASSLFNPANFYLNCAQVTNLNSFFANCSSFNPSVFDIVTTSATSMEAMFQNCISFNHPVNFNTQNVTNMSQMFQNCTNFNQNISNLTFNKNVVMNFFMGGKSSTNYDASYYDAFLQKFSEDTVGRTNTDKRYSMGTIKYTIVGKPYRDALVADGWPISDGGMI